VAGRDRPSGGAPCHFQSVELVRRVAVSYSRDQLPSVELIN